MNPYQGTFTWGNKTLIYDIELVNTGTLGTDTYNLASTSNWPLNLYDATGNPLSDTNGDSIVDTGSVSQGETTKITVQVQTPTIINPTDENSFTATAISTKDNSKSKTATFQAAVPVPFAQAFSKGGMGLYLVKPDNQREISLSNSGWDMAIAETPGFVYIWNTSQWLDGISVIEIEYTILDDTGNVTRPSAKIADHTGATMDTYDSNPTIAIAPDGSIGILWDRMLINDEGLRNYNTYLVILDSNGDAVYGPVNLTNNSGWV